MPPSDHIAANAEATVRSNCVFCDASFADVARAPVRCQFTASGTLPSNKSWCAGCDAPDAAVRARRAIARLRAIAEAEQRRAYMAEYNARPEVIAKKRQACAAERFRHRKSFRCAECTGRFAGNREAKRLRDGRTIRLGLCAYCAAQLYGPPVTAPKGGWAAYQRAWRQTPAGVAARKAYDATPERIAANAAWRARYRERQRASGGKAQAA